MNAGQAVVLSPKDVRRIRGYVKQKYATLSDQSQAEIVADAVKQVLYKRLPDFEESLKQQLLTDLIQTYIQTNSGPVSQEQIIELCSKLNLADPLIAQPYVNWLDESKSILENVEATAALHTENKLSGEKNVSKSWQTKFLNNWQRNKKTLIFGGLSLILIASLVGYFQAFAPVTSRPAEEAIINNTRTAAEDKVQAVSSINELPETLRFQLTDTAKLKLYLEGKASILAEEPYFSAIIDAAKQFDIHPVLLFAITGQEQAFVPKTHKRAKEIANNPFNVFHSWKDFNTSISESAQIAGRTIARLSKDRPEGTDAITWINREYAEDPKWSDGVRIIFTSINRFIEKEL